MSLLKCVSGGEIPDILARARYIIRLDDACPTMLRAKWDRFESIIDRFRVRPIVAIVPENRDPKLEADTRDETFWERVLAWRDKGWHLALHGHDHVYITKSGGLVPINSQSEFADVPLSQQKQKLKRGVELFAEKGFRPQIWVAPSHSFDSNTLVALREETSIRVISDGIALWPYSEGPFFWVPQQRWKLSVAACGVWTACYHPNTASLGDLRELEDFLITHHQQMVGDVQSLRTEYGDRRRSLLDRLLTCVFFVRLRAKRRLSHPTRRRS